MKKIYDILGVLALSATVLTSCVGDLNVTPIDPNANTADKALVNEAAYEQFLAGVYLGFATSGYYGKDGGPSISGLDGGASQYIRGLYHHSELTTDESVCGWNDQTIKNFHWMNWTTDDTFIYAFYSRIFMQVSMANEFIREAKASSVDFAKKQQYIDEARVLRALAYYHAIDNFGNVPFADETAVVGVNPDQISRADLYAWLEEELKDLVSNSALPDKAGTTYGHVNKSVAKFLLAKLYLNAEVYTGAAAYDKCANVLADLMDDGYSLHTTSAGTYSAYQELFLADNDRCTDEIIFAVEQDGVNTTSYGATNYLIFASTGGAMDPDEMGISSGWGGLRMTPEFYPECGHRRYRRVLQRHGLPQVPQPHQRRRLRQGVRLRGYRFPDDALCRRPPDGGRVPGPRRCRERCHHRLQRGARPRRRRPDCEPDPPGHPGRACPRTLSGVLAPQRPHPFRQVHLRL